MHAVSIRAPFKLAALSGPLIALALAQAAHAQAPQTLPAITVQSTLAPTTLEQTPASITVVDGDKARDRQWQVNLSEALPGVPGLPAMSGTHRDRSATAGQPHATGPLERSAGLAAGYFRYSSL